MTRRTAATDRRSFVLAACAAVSGCAAPRWLPPPATPIGAPTVRLGDRWRYRVINRYNGSRIGDRTMEVAELAPLLRIRVTEPGGARLPDETYAAPWRVVQEPAYDEVMIFRDPAPVLPRQLAQGAGERFESAYRIAGRDAWLYWSESVDALGWERVRVPAGEFEALRVLRRIAFVHSDAFRERNERQETLWYAPAVNRWVAREWTGSYYWPGMRRSPPLRDDWVESQLLEYRPA